METIMNKSPIFVKKRVIMSTSELKLNLHNLIEGIENESLLNAIYVLITQKKVKEKTEVWADLPEEVRKDIDEALLESERGEGIPHSEVIKTIKKKYPEYENYMDAPGIKDLFSSL
jgi:transcription elongation factor GreA-like protein